MAHTKTSKGQGIMAPPEKHTGRFKTTPLKHQLRCLKEHSNKLVWANTSEMGTGKTWIAINWIADLWGKGACSSVIVFAPNGVHANWTLQEIPKHMPDWVRYRMAAWSSNAKKAERDALEAMYEDPGEKDLRILTMNWEALQYPRGFAEAKRFATCAQSLMIVGDESANIANPQTKRYKNLMKLKPYSKFRHIMDGTVIAESPFDAFGQYNFLSSTILDTTSFYAFKAEYCEMLQEGNQLLEHIKKKTGSSRTPQVPSRGANGRPKYRNLDKLAKLIAPYSFRVLKSECIDLPPKVYKTAYFDMTKEQLAAYKTAKDECRLLLNDEPTPFNKLAVAMKLSQITSGYYIHPSEEDAIPIPGDNPKLDLLMERVDAIISNGHKVIVWARFTKQIEDISMRLKEAGHKHVLYYGAVKKAERVEAINEFEKGDASVFVGNQQAGGTGITLVAASYVIYFSNSFSLRDRLQSEDRAHRIGQTNSVTYINLVARKTIDEAIVGALSSKKQVASVIIDSNL